MKSIVKWMGSKRLDIKHFEKYIPAFDTYIETFAGGASLFWNLKPEKAIINDIDDILINFYRCISKPKAYLSVLKRLAGYKNEENFFYYIRDRMNTVLAGELTISQSEVAAMFYYINKCGYSGHWRFNKSGKLNVPYGRYNNDNFKAIDDAYHKIAQKAMFINKDYSDVFSGTYEGQVFNFLDPPYLDCGEMYANDSGLSQMYQDIRDYMVDTDHAVMLVVKEHDVVYGLFENMIVDTYTKTYRVKSTTEKSHKHLIICNY